MSSFHFYRSFVRCRQVSIVLCTPALRPYSGLVRLPKERKGIGMCVGCVLVMSGEGGLSRSEQLVGYFYSATSSCGLLSRLALTAAVYYASQGPAKSIYFDSRRRSRQT